MSVHKPVGYCIYCGKKAGKLTREHIIPFGLGGTWVLPKASCQMCATITSNVERFCLRPMLGQFRIHMKLPTRRRDKRPGALPLEIVRADGTVLKKDVSVEELPITYIGFDWPPPRLLEGKPPQQTFDGQIVVRHMGPESFLKHGTAGDKIKIGSVSMPIFARMLAKIAHSFAVANLPPGQFRPMLPEFILGLADINASSLVGGDKSGWSPTNEPQLHSVCLQDYVANHQTYVLARISLFDFFKLPAYHVVVGQKLGPPTGKPIAIKAGQ